MIKGMEKVVVVPVVQNGGDLHLRPWDAHTDLHAVVEAGMDPLIPSITTVARNGDRQQAAAFVDRQDRRLAEDAGYSFAIARREGGPAVGQIGVWTKELEQKARVTLGYWVAPGMRRRRIAVEALRLATDWAHTALGAVRCQLFVEPFNEGSWLAAERAGYEREGLLRAWELRDGEWRDLFMYGAVRQPGR